MTARGLVFLVALLLCAGAHAHRSGCHRWHSCPSDSGSYVCGDTGHCNYCPDNRYCRDGRPRSAEPASPPDRSTGSDKNRRHN